MALQSIVRSGFVIGSTAVELAGNFGGVPFAGPAAVLLGELGRSCEQVQIHKSECRHLVRYVEKMVDVLRDGSSGLEGTTLQEAADSLEMIMLQVHEKMIKWSCWGMVRAYWKRDEISKGIRSAKRDLQLYQERFHIQAQMFTAEKIQDAELNRQRDWEETQTVLRQILRQQEHTLSLLEMRQGGEAAAEIVMRDAQTELHSFVQDSPRYTEYQGYVFNLYNSTGVLPTLPNLSCEITLKERHVFGGPYSEVSLGLWLGKVDVALKSLREVKASLPRAQKRFEHEITIWHTLQHPNILPFLGIVDNLGPHICVVSPWQANGNILDFCKRNPETDRLNLLVGAARGIAYLHSRDKPVVHGNLKCSNILVSDKGEAVLSDFGLSRVVEDITEIAASNTLTTHGGNRWCAPELMNDNSSPNMETDVYGFSMSILECLTSARPFIHLKRDPLVVLSVMRKERPRRPDAQIWDRWFTEDLWTLLERCWSHDPSLRPPMSSVLVELSRLAQEAAQRHYTS